VAANDKIKSLNKITISPCIMFDHKYYENVEKVFLHSFPLNNEKYFSLKHI